MSIKKKILLAWLGLEVITLVFGLPAAAQIIDKVMFKSVPRAAYVETMIAPGKIEILVASNAPFVILSQGVIGEMQMEFSVNGSINGVRYGRNAQNPGAVTPCVLPVTSAPSILYKAVRKTAANRGEVIEQAVKFTVYFDPDMTPDFTVKTLNQDIAKRASIAPLCRPDLS